MSSGVESYLNALADGDRAVIEALRSIVLKGVPHAIETIKWNAPSFAVDGEDRITLGLDRKGGARLVLHRGAKPQAPMDLSHIDQGSLAKWPSADRGVVTFRNLEDIRARESDLTTLCATWISAAS